MSAIIGMPYARFRVVMLPRATPIPASNLAPSDSSAHNSTLSKTVVT